MRAAGSRSDRRLGLIPLLLIGSGILVCVVVASRLIGLDATSSVNSSNEALVASSKRLLLSGQLELNVIDLQTGARGFLITGERSFLAPRNLALRRIPALERRLLESVAADDRGDRRALRRLFARIRRYMRILQPRVLALARDDPGAARELVANGRGDRQVAAMRDEFASFAAAQSAAQSRLQSTAERRTSRAEAIEIAGLAAVVLLVAILIFLAARGVVAPVRRLADSRRARARGEAAAGGAGGRQRRLHGDRRRRRRARLDAPCGGDVRLRGPREALGRPVEELTLPKSAWPAPGAG